MWPAVYSVFVVMFSLMLCRCFSLFGGEQMVSVCQMSVMACRFVGTSLMVLRRFPMISGCMFLVFSSSWRKSKVAFTYPSKRSVEAVRYKVKSLTTRTTTHLSLRDLLLHLNSVLRGWAMYFRYDASKRTLAYVDNFA
jgi:group II intron maturase